jgi:branched-chain amino acid transport system substrate-binding protein
VFDPQATGITFALTEKVPTDKVPLITLGYGLSVAQDGQAFKWNFPLMGSYWTGADILIQHIGKKEGGLDKLKGKKIALVYHDSPFGKEPIPLLQERAKMHGFDLQLIPVTAPGVEQKSAWLQVRQTRPDFVLLWGWGVMNSTALKEAQATGYPRDKMYGVWWAGAEPDVKDVGEGAKGYNALALNTSGTQPKVIQDIMKYVHDKGQGTGPKDEVGQVLYTRGVIIQMLSIEAVRRAQERFGKGKVMTGEQVRWGMENLALDQKRLDALGFSGVMRPVSTSCSDHMGSTAARVQTWNGSKWEFSSDFIQADEQILKPMIKAGADKYLADKKMTRPYCPADWQSSRRGFVTALPNSHRGGRGGRLSRSRQLKGPFGPGSMQPTLSIGHGYNNDDTPNIVLNVNGIEVIYNHVILVLKGVSLQVPQGRIVAILGGNGAGKTTTLRAISNLLRGERGEVTKGSIELRGERIENLSPADLVQRGVVQVMEGRHCFAHLTIEENLLTGAYTRTSKAEVAANLEKVYNYFPRLKTRRTSQAAYTSGGEQQMCAIGRALMASPSMVLLDEPSMGLAPQIVEEVFNIVKDLNQKEQVTFLLAEQNTNMALKYADYGYIMESGRVVMDGAASDLANNEDVKEFYLGVGGGERKSFKDVKSYKRRKRWLA